jgi:hypothetical protein
MRRLVIVATLLLSSTARGDVGLGLFLGEPLGLDLKFDIQRRSSLDMVFGWTTIRDASRHYGHVTYLITPIVGHGDSVMIPLRIGIGGAIYDAGSFANEVNLAVRAPLELGLRFRRTPLEIYGEIALEITFLDENNNDETVKVQGGVGIRFYF